MHCCFEKDGKNNAFLDLHKCYLSSCPTKAKDLQQLCNYVLWYKLATKLFVKIIIVINKKKNRKCNNYESFKFSLAIPCKWRYICVYIYISLFISED